MFVLFYKISFNIILNSFKTKVFLYIHFTFNHLVIYYKFNTWHEMDFDLSRIKQYDLICIGFATDEFFQSVFVSHGVGQWMHTFT